MAEAEHGWGCERRNVDTGGAEDTGVGSSRGGTGAVAYRRGTRGVSTETANGACAGGSGWRSIDG